MQSESQAFDILQQALDAAAADEADAVFIASDRNISRFANSSVHQNMSETTGELTLRVVIGGAFGVASTTLLDAEEIRRTAELACEAARLARALPGFAGLHRRCGAAPLLRTWDEATALIAPAAKARELRRIFDRGRSRGIDFAGAYSTAAMSVACGNTHGLRRFCRTTSAEATVIAIHSTRFGYASRSARSTAGLDVLALGDEASEKATLRSDAELQFEPGRYDVILEPPAIAEVLDWMNMITFCGQAFEDGSSFFVGNIGAPLLSDALTLADDSLDESFLPFPFDLEGFPKRRVALVERGVIRTPVVDKAWSDRLGIPPTGNAWHLGSPDHGVALHLAVDPGQATREELIASTERGIWVTRFNYVNGLLEPKTALMTGTTRDGTFLIRDGRVAGRLPNLRWTQSILEAFSNIAGLTRERRAVGTWYNPFGGTVAPAMKIRGWNFTAG
ncbi:MAG TPA: metallopeptidase TldD-related protein [Thermoanaerobaculia bacterium]|nr:metallopeptidase TldD-related protein [Thermoanaerobaculia bacterium]